nr:unnamed protein product [Callosobruchus analis]
MSRECVATSVYVCCFCLYIRRTFELGAVGRSPTDLMNTIKKRIQKRKIMIRSNRKYNSSKIQTVCLFVSSGYIREASPSSTGSRAR